jgi:hypothetical protein
MPTRPATPLPYPENQSLIEHCMYRFYMLLTQNYLRKGRTRIEANIIIPYSLAWLCGMPAEG